MTFDEYNTDEVFKGNSTADELVKLAKDEGKTREDVEKSLSPLWKEDKRGNVKKALDKYFTVEEPKAEEKTAPKVEEMTQTTEALEKPAEPFKEDTTAPTKKQTALDKDTEQYMATNTEIADRAEDNEYERQKAELFKRWDSRNANIDKMSDSMKNIDDKLIAQLPTFMFRRYENGEFGDPKSEDAKLRLAYFTMNNVVSKLKTLANADAAYRGRGQIFSDTESAYDKYQRTNLEQGLENRWNKYKQETQSAIDVAKQGGLSEEAITDSIATISANNRLQSAFNQMNERQKVFALNVLAEIGDKMGNMNDEKFVNTLMGMSAMGDSLDVKEAAGMLVYRTVKDPEKRDQILSSLGLLTGNVGTGILGGIGDALTGDKKEDKDTGVTLEDGTKVDPGKTMDKKELEELRAAAEDLGQKYYDGKISEEEFRKEYSKLEKVMSEHGVRNFISGGIKSQDDYIKQIRINKQTELTGDLEELNANAKNISKDDYLKQFENLKADAIKWGADKKQLEAIDKAKEKSLKVVGKNVNNKKK